jgi:hypothetical protein
MANTFDGYRSTTKRNDARAGFFEKRSNCGGLSLAKPGFAFRRENFRHAFACQSFDVIIEIEERHAERFGHESPHGAFAGCHEAAQNNGSTHGSHSKASACAV